MASQGKSTTSATARRAPPPALNPESPGLVQPWKDFLSKGWISSLRVEFTPLGSKVLALPGHSSIMTSDPAELEGLPLGVVKERIVKAGLWTPKGSKASPGKTEQALPLRSLTKRDFEGDAINNLQARAEAVAKALTDTVARGRIGSLKLMIEGVDTFETWWKRAPHRDKSRLLTDGKHFEQLTDADHAALAARLTSCPFRGSVPTPTHEETDDEEEPKPPTKRNGSPKTNSL
jgi:hypothetical protein